MKYETVKAENAQQALERSTFKVGDVVRISNITPIANSGGTYSLFYTFAQVNEYANSSQLAPKPL